MTTRSRLVLAIHSWLLRTAATPLRGLWWVFYRAAARAWAAYLRRGEPDASGYVRGSIAGGEALPGLSDVDVALVLAEDAAGPGRARMRVRERWQRLRRRFPLTDLLLDFPLIVEQEQLDDVTGSSALTYDGAMFHGPGFSEDKLRLLERPGVYGQTSDWILLSGSERRPPEPPRDDQEQRLAAWLELVYWWQWVTPACADPGPRTASLCVKLVAEPARIWLWLAHGIRCASREEVFGHALARLPGEGEGLQLALELERSLPRSPRPPLAEVLPLALRLSARIADRLAHEVAPAGTTEVRLAGASGLLLPNGPEGAADPLPLSDWRSLTRPEIPDESFAPFPGDPADPAALLRAHRAFDFGPLPALRSGRLLVFPGERTRTELRAIQCPLTDPVSFALADGRHDAAFANVRGWSAHDWARRAVAEHRAWLRAVPKPAPGLRQDKAPGGVLAMLFTAARAALFHDSVAAGEPELPLTTVATAERLAARPGAGGAVGEALDHYREFVRTRTPPPQATLGAMRSLVEALPPYLDPLGHPAGLLAVEP